MSRDDAEPGRHVRVARYRRRRAVLFRAAFGAICHYAQRLIFPPHFLTLRRCRPASWTPPRQRCQTARAAVAGRHVYRAELPYGRSPHDNTAAELFMPGLQDSFSLCATSHFTRGFFRRRCRRCDKASTMRAFHTMHAASGAMGRFSSHYLHFGPLEMLLRRAAISATACRRVSGFWQHRLSAFRHTASRAYI